MLFGPKMLSEGIPGGHFHLCQISGSRAVSAPLGDGIESALMADGSDYHLMVTVLGAKEVGVM